MVGGGGLCRGVVCVAGIGSQVSGAKQGKGRIVWVRRESTLTLPLSYFIVVWFLICSTRRGM